MTVMTIALVGTVVADCAARKLATTVALALKRADVTQDYVARVTGIPPNKLSLQLSGQAPFTGLCRILISHELRHETDFWQELVMLMAQSIDRALVPNDIAALVSKVDQLVNKKHMAKAALIVMDQQERA